MLKYARAATINTNLKVSTQGMILENKAGSESKKLLLMESSAFKDKGLPVEA
jgi:hypothetical protein